MPVVFKPMALNAAGGGGAPGRADQWLNRCLFINAEDGGMPRWVQIQSDNVGGFRLKVRIIACHRLIQPMRLQPSFFRNAMDGILADAELPRRAAAAQRGTIPGRLRVAEKSGLAASASAPRVAVPDGRDPGPAPKQESAASIE